MTADPSREAAGFPPTFLAAVRVWLKIGLVSFGGPAGQIAILHEELVDRRKWIDEGSFLTALNFCMLLPGPEAQQLATYLGLKLHGLRGALAAGILFVLPGAIVLFALAWLAAAHGAWPPLQSAFRGMLPIVVALVANAVLRIGARTLKTPASWALAIVAFVGIGVLGITFPWIIGAALVVGLASVRLGFVISPGGAHGLGPASVPTTNVPTRRALWRALRLVGLFLLLWLMPIGLVLLFAGPAPFADVAIFFTEAAFVTFGGAYAVLPFVAHGAVAHYAWLSRAEMVHGLALAETTPGPLILVTQYVGFFAGWNAALTGHAGGLSPLLAGVISAALTTWVTFLPSFYFVLAGAPVVERMSHSRWAHAAMSGVSSAVVGVMATLALTIAREAFFVAGRMDLVAIAAAAIAFLAAWRFKGGALWLVAAGAAYGRLRYTAFP